MKIYLDDHSSDHVLATLLRKAGHEVTAPEEVGMAKQSDPKHLVYALDHQLTVLTRNHQDFNELHDVVIACGGKHHGMLIVRVDNNRLRDMKNPDIVVAIGKLLRANQELVNQVHILNHWR